MNIGVFQKQEESIPIVTNQDIWQIMKDVHEMRSFKLQDNGLAEAELSEVSSGVWGRIGKEELGMKML